MKIRTGFVSNSSSSSFCVLGQYLPVYKIQELVPELYKNGVELYAYSENVSAETHVWFGEDSNIEEELKSYNHWVDLKDKFLVGIDIDGKSYPELSDKKELLLKVLGGEEKDLSIHGWGYYSG